MEVFSTIAKLSFPIVEKSLRSNGRTQFYLRKIGVRTNKIIFAKLKN